MPMWPSITPVWMPLSISWSSRNRNMRGTLESEPRTPRPPRRSLHSVRKKSHQPSGETPEFPGRLEAVRPKRNRWRQGTLFNRFGAGSDRTPSTTCHDADDLQTITELDHSLTEFRVCNGLAIVFHHHAAGKKSELPQEFFEATRLVQLHILAIGDHTPHGCNGS